MTLSYCLSGRKKICRVWASVVLSTLPQMFIRWSVIARDGSKEAPLAKSISVLPIEAWKPSCWVWERKRERL